jgi:uncharacterized protein (TIGR02246 family)
MTAFRDRKRRVAPAGELRSVPPNPRVQRTRSSPSARHSPLTRCPSGVGSRREFVQRQGFAVVLGMLAWIGCATSGRTSNAASEILQLDAEWSRAAQSRDVERTVSFWAEDATVFPPGRPAVVGKTAIREFVTKSFQTPGFSISWNTTTVVVSRSGDFAYTTGTNRVSFSAPDGKQLREGKAVAVWRRGKDGVWKCVVDIWNDVSPSQ